MLSPTQESAAHAACADLRNQCNTAIANASTLSSSVLTYIYGDAGSRDATIANIRTLLNDVDGLEGEQLDEVRMEFQSYDWWVAQASNLYDAIAYQAKLQGEWSGLAGLKQAAAQTVTDVQNDAHQVAAAAFPVAAMVAIALVALVVLKVT